jgi:hypothetical protein
MLLLFPLSGCVGDGEFAPIPAGNGFSEFSDWWQGRTAPANVPATGASKMLQDPESETHEWTQELWAENQDTAQNLCDDIADRQSQGGNPTTQLGRPAQVYKKASKYGQYLWRCHFSTETTALLDDRRNR